MNMIGSNAFAMLGQQAEEIIAELMAVSFVDASNASVVKDLITTAKRLAKDIDESRKLTKAPHVKAAESVDEAYNPIRDKVTSAWSAPHKMLEAWALSERKRAEADAEAARKAAEKAAKECEEADPFLTDMTPVAEANTAAAIAATRALASKQVIGATGVSTLKTYRSAEVTDAKALVLYYAEHPDVLGAATKLANAAIRAAKGGPVNIPGIAVKEEKRLA